jgi:hypothetical protein
MYSNRMPHSLAQFWIALLMFSGPLSQRLHLINRFWYRQRLGFLKRQTLAGVDAQIPFPVNAVHPLVVPSQAFQIACTSTPTSTRMGWSIFEFVTDTAMARASLIMSEIG